MSAKVIRRGVTLWAAHISGVVIGVVLGAGLVGFSVGMSLPLECRNILTGYIAQQ